MIPQETIDRILDLTKVEEVIGDFVSLKRRGSSYVACCPFHSERTPSFTVTPSKGFYYCFGCHKGGSAVNFLMEHENMSYVEAIRYLASKYNVEIQEEEESDEVKRLRQQRESLYLASEFAANFYASCLEEGEGRAVGYNYFRSRGMEDDTIRRFGLGWSPSDRQALLNAAAEKGYKAEYLVKAGICIQTSDDRIYDRFHDRVIFPIYSDSGKVVAFGGRTLFSDFKDRGIGKYVNSPETEIYIKKNSLYGLYQAKSSIAKEDCCILVEGNIDVISMHQLGLTNTVASCGTSLTIEQLRKIRRFTNNLVIVYDGDSAGIKAADRGINLALREGLDVKVVLLPDGKDPDDYCRSHSLEEVKGYISRNATDFIRFKAGLSLEAAADDPLKRAQVINEIADTIALIPDPVKRSVYTDFCSDLMTIDRNSVMERVDLTKQRIAEEEWKRNNSARRQEQAASAGEQDSGQKEAVPAAVAVVQNASPLEPMERSLLEFILNDGLIEMAFPAGHSFYSDPPVTVAEFIDSSLAEDELALTVPEYKATYEAYFHYYDEGLEQDEILRKLVLETDPRVPACVAALTSRRHEVTGTKLLASITSEQTIALKGVPKALLLYRDKLLEQEETRLREELSKPGADVRKLLAQIKQTAEQRRILQRETGRI